MLKGWTSIAAKAGNAEAVKKNYYTKTTEKDAHIILTTYK